MRVRGIRGATVVREDRADLIRDATGELLQAIVEANRVATSDIVSIVITTTPDLRSEYPTRAVRDLGWLDVAALGAVEVEVPGGLPRCIRVLMHVNDGRPAGEVEHVYLREARILRPDR